MTNHEKEVAHVAMELVDRTDAILFLEFNGCKLRSRQIKALAKAVAELIVAERDDRRR